MSRFWQGTTALVTGASRGIGRALALELSRRGANLVLVARDAALLDAVAGEVRSGGTEVQAIATDLGRPAAPAELEREIGRRGLEIDHLVNNAGIGPRGRFEATPLGDHLATIDLNVRTATELAARCLPGMLARRRGGILNIASTAAFQGLVWMPAYAASKAYLVTWSEALWASLRGTGVRCTCVAPGPVDTSFFEANAWGFRPPGWVLQPAGTVAERAIEAYEGDRCLCIPSLPFRLAAWSVRLVPRAVAARLGAFYGRSRPGPAA